MPFNPFLQLSVRYVFKDIGAFELFQFGGSFGNLEDSLDVILPKMKELNFFRTSMAYMGFTDSAVTSSDKDVFGNYNFQSIQGKDYVPVPFDKFISSLSFTFNQQRGYVSEHFSSDPNKIPESDIMHFMRQIAKLHMNENEYVYQLTIQDEEKEKIGEVCIWENFKNFVAIDRGKKVIHLVTIGRD